MNKIKLTLFTISILILSVFFNNAKIINAQDITEVPSVNIHTIRQLPIFSCNMVFAGSPHTDEACSEAILSGEGIAGATIKIYNESTNTLLLSKTVDADSTWKITHNDLEGLSITNSDWLWEDNLYVTQTEVAKEESSKVNVEKVIFEEDVVIEVNYASEGEDYVSGKFPFHSDVIYNGVVHKKRAHSSSGSLSAFSYMKASGNSFQLYSDDTYIFPISGEVDYATEDNKFKNGDKIYLSFNTVVGNNHFILEEIIVGAESVKPAAIQSLDSHTEASGSIKLGEAHDIQEIAANGPIYPYKPDQKCRVAETYDRNECESGITGSIFHNGIPQRWDGYREQFILVEQVADTATYPFGKPVLDSSGNEVKVRVDKFGVRDISGIVEYQLVIPDSVPHGTMLGVRGVENAKKPVVSEWFKFDKQGPIITPIGVQTLREGEPIVPIEIKASDENGVRFKSAVLPSGLSIDESTLIITGTPEFKDAEITVELVDNYANVTTYVIKLAKHSAPTLPSNPVETPKPVAPVKGRSCQDDGYPVGYYWSESENKCIVKNYVVPKTSTNNMLKLNMLVVFMSFISLYLNKKK